MKKNIFTILALAVVAFVGCTKDETTDYIKYSGDAVEFGVGATTRTAYEYADSRQIIWETDDKIRIFSHEAQTDAAKGTADKAVYADYTVSPDDTNATYGKIGSTGTTNPLKWGELVDGARPGHTFYAVFPANDNITVKNGVATFPINRNQKCTVTESSKKEDAAYTYVAKPDMSNAYMVARAASNPTDGEVWLDFKPVMTTLNIVVNGPQNMVDTNNDGVADTPVEPGADNYSKADTVLVTGVSIISTLTTNATSLDTFNYDFSNSNSDKWAISGSASSGTETASEKTETTFISLINNIGDASTNPNYGASAVELAEGESISITAFLPPMAVATMEALKRNIEIRVHTTGGNKTLSLGESTLKLTPSDKGTIKLPNMFTPIENSAWMTPLDDDIYVSQLSIPGTHDAATKNCSLSQGRCQDLTIAQQLEMGIRFFDLRPNKDLNIYHGKLSCGISLIQVWEQFNAFLDKNPGEFIFTLIKWEYEPDVSLLEGISDNLADYSGFEDFNSNMMNFVSSDEYKKYALPDGEGHTGIKRDLTIGEMRPEGTFTIDNESVTRKQGRILTMLRPNHNIYMYNGNATAERKWALFIPTGRYGEYCDTYITGGDESAYAPDGMIFYTNFPGSLNNRVGFLKKKFVDYSSTGNGGNGMGQMASQSVSVPTNWNVYCQNYFEVSNNTDDINSKINAVKETIEQATTEANNLSHTWVINHCSGYAGSALQSTAYATLAHNMNPEIYKYINSRTPGSLGFVLLDFVGSRYSSASSTLQVYGDLLPQTIIDNNYKYRMKRKGE